MKLKLLTKFKSVPRVGYLLALFVVLNGVFFVYVGYLTNPFGLRSKLQSLTQQTPASSPKLSSADYQEYLTLIGRIEALVVKLPTEGAISERLRTSLEELKNELGDNKAVLEDPRTTDATTEKTRERNKVIAQTLDQMEKDLSSEFGGFAAFEAAANEQTAISNIFYSPRVSTILWVNGMYTTKYCAANKNSILINLSVENVRAANQWYCLYTCKSSSDNWKSCAQNCTKKTYDTGTLTEVTNASVGSSDSANKSLLEAIKSYCD